MTKATISISALTTSNQTKKYNLGYANPEVTDAKLLQLAQKVNGLTSNTLVKVEKQLVTDISNTVIPYTAKIVSTSDFFSTDPTKWQTFMNNHINSSSAEVDLLWSSTTFNIKTGNLTQWTTENPNFNFESLIEKLILTYGDQQYFPTLTAKNGELDFEFPNGDSWYNKFEIEDQTAGQGVINDIWNKATDKTYTTFTNNKLKIVGTRE